jgi:diguanylate cyclase (GGDEF)-like protein
MLDGTCNQSDLSRPAPLFRRLWAFRLNGLSTKLYCVAIFSIVAVTGLAAASIYFAKITETAAHRLYGDGFVGVVSSSRLELLIEQHRRIVESMPAEVDRARLDNGRARLKETAGKLTTLIQDLLADRTDPNADAIEQEIFKSFSPLFTLGDRVAFYARDFAQDKALEIAEQYASSADYTQGLIRRYREQRGESAHRAMSDLANSATSLTIWVWICAIAAFVLIGPIGLAITRGVVSRLSRVTESMIEVADRNTTVAIPSCDDRDEVGAMARAVAIFKENAIQLMAQTIELEQVNGRLDVALNNMTHGLCMFNAHRQLIVCNDTYGRMYDLPPALVEPGTAYQRIYDHRIKIGNGSLATPEEIAAEAANGSADGPCAFTQELMDGRIIAISQQPMPDGGWVAVHEDVTERRRAEAKIAYLARHDTVTGLPNRVKFREHLEQNFANLREEQKFAVLCLDLDHFKQVNDTLGHPVGDQLLKCVAERLHSCIQDTDLVARIGGDEFAIVQDRRLQSRRTLELDLRSAIVHGEFELHYQPILNLQSNEVSGFEALIRWNNPVRGQILPLQFIPLAEETGLILPIGEWVLRTACAQAAAWSKPVSVAVNLSPAQFKSQDLVQLVLNALASSGLEPARLELEITESVLLQNEASTRAILHKLRALGVRIAMDDFGTGYSSLAYLRSFPFDKIKIDRSFVRDMTRSEECAAIVRAVAGLARSLNIITVVEGIETSNQLEMARSEGCDEGQGYLFGRPAPAAEARRILGSEERIASAA